MAQSVTTDSRLVTQADRSDAGRDVETGAAFETDRLKRDRSAEPPTNTLARSNPDRGACGCAGKFARSAPGARSEVGASTPQMSTPASCIADIDPESPNTADNIRYGPTRRKGAAERPR